jgi:alpha-galactosidase
MTGTSYHKIFLCVLSLSLSIGFSQASFCQSATPPMGWNSWDAFGTSVTEEEVRATADAMAEKLTPFGWIYLVVDIQWYAAEAQGHDYRPGMPLTMDEYGRLTPALNRFPSAEGSRGFTPLAEYVHSKGLKFGIHIMRGIPRQAVEKNSPIKGTALHAADIADPENPCSWNPDMLGVDMTKPGAQEYYNSIAELYASWGVDFVKADDMASHLYQPAEIKALSTAMRSSGRPMLLSLSPGPAPETEARFFKKYATMWRISDDFWDKWPLLKQQFEYARTWAPHIGEDNTWPDADMLPLGLLKVTDPARQGHPTRFTPDEQQTVMTLWAIIRSPLIMGGDIRRIDRKTLELLTNPEVITVNQKSRNNIPALQSGDMQVWTAAAQDGSLRYAAFFNLGEKELDVNTTAAEIGLPAGSYSVRDLWKRVKVGVSDRIQLRLAPHASALFELHQE